MTRLRPVAAFLLGAWLLGSLFMTVVATRNFRAVEALLTAPPSALQPALAELGPRARALLRYQAGDLNRRYFVLWEWVQLLLGISLVAVLVAGRADRLTIGLAAAMLAIVVVMRLGVTPTIEQLGRVTEFLPVGADVPERARFWRYHQTYSTLEVGKWLVALVLSYRLLVPSRA